MAKDGDRRRAAEEPDATKAAAPEPEVRRGDHTEAALREADPRALADVDVNAKMPGADLAPDGVAVADFVAVDAEVSIPDGVDEFVPEQSTGPGEPDGPENDGTFGTPGSYAGDDALDGLDLGLDAHSALDEFHDERAADIPGQGDLGSSLLPTEPPPDATHPGFDDPTATVAADPKPLTAPPLSPAGFMKNHKWDENDGIVEAEPGEENLSAPVGGHHIDANEKGAVDDDGSTVQQQWKNKMQEILEDKDMKQEEKEEAMTELAAKVQKVTSGKQPPAEEPPAQEPAEAEPATDDGTGDDLDVEIEEPAPAPDDTDADPDGINPDNVEIDFSDPEWQIKASADANDDIQYADHPGTDAGSGAGTDYDGVDYGEEFAQPDDIPADAVDSVWEDPTIDPHDDPYASDLGIVDDAEDAAADTDGMVDEVLMD